MLERDKWQARAGRFICLAIIFAAVYIALKYALGLILPFLFAIVIGAPISSFAKKSSAFFGGPRKAWAIFYIAVFWSAILLSAVLLARRVGQEAADMIVFLGENADNISARIESIVNSVTELPSRIPFLQELDGAGGYAKELTSGLIEKIVSEGGGALAAGVGRAILKTPAAVMSVVVCVISGVYIALDWEGIKQYFFDLMSDKAKNKSTALLARITKGAKGYLKAYFWLFVINFIQLYTGLALMKVRYAFLISLVLAFFDMLPLFSAGAILIPWGVLSIIEGSYLTGVGMLALFGVMAIIRQIAEPRLVGKGLGLHPLASLASMYIGFRVFGFWGMMLAPICILVLKEIFEADKKGEKIEEKT